MVTWVGWFAIGVGALMLVWWGAEIRAGVLRRDDRRPVEIGLHLVAEILTAVLLIVGGLVLLTDGGPSVVLVGLGMLLYTVIQSPGYFVARREIPPVVLFGVLIVATVGAIVAVW